MKVRELLPVELWNNFEDLNAVPRPSKKEERVIEFIKNFGLNLGLDTYVDPSGNVIIKKPASKPLNFIIFFLKIFKELIYSTEMFISIP